MKTLVDTEKLFDAIQQYCGSSICREVMKAIRMGSVKVYPAKLITSVCIVDDILLKDCINSFAPDMVEYKINQECMESFVKSLPKAKIDPSGQDLFKQQTMYRKTFLLLDNREEKVGSQL